DTITGTLEGNVYDDRRAPLPGVRLRVINQETGNQRATLTNIQGHYRIAFLPLGKYKIEVVKEGFTLTEPTKEPIKIQLNQTFLTIPDIIMSPAPVAAVATPAPTQSLPPSAAATASEEAAGSLTNQFDAARRANGDEQQVALLPLFGNRSFDE